MKKPSLTRLLWTLGFLGICSYFVHLTALVRVNVSQTSVLRAVLENYSHQHGLVLAPGSERVEVLSLLWGGTLCIAHSLTAALSPRTLAVLIACSALYAVTRFRAWSDATAPRWMALLIPLTIALDPSFVRVCAAGLEHPMFVLLSVLTFAAFAAEERDSESAPHSSWLVAFVVATRIEALAFVPGFLLAKALRSAMTNRRRQDSTWALVTLLSLAAVTLFRLAYFANAVPRYGLFALHWQPVSRWSVSELFPLLSQYWVGSWLWLLAAAPLTKVPSSRLGPVLAVLFAILITVPYAPNRAAVSDWLCAVIPLAIVLAFEGMHGIFQVISNFVPRQKRRVAALLATCGFAITSATAVRGRSGSSEPVLDDNIVVPAVVRASIESDRDASVSTTRMFQDEEIQPWRMSIVPGTYLYSAWVFTDQSLIMPANYLRLDNGWYLDRTALAAPFGPANVAVATTGRASSIAVSESEADANTELLLTLVVGAETVGAPLHHSKIILCKTGEPPVELQVPLLTALCDRQTPFSPAERPIFRTLFRLPTEGTYELQWKSEAGVILARRSLVARAGASLQSAHAMVARLDQAMAQNDDRTATIVARQLIQIRPSSRAAELARTAVRRYGKMLADRARMMADAGALSIAGALGEHILWLTHEPALAAPIAERLLDAAQLARQQHSSQAMVWARAALRVDPRKSWARAMIGDSPWQPTSVDPLLRALEQSDSESALNQGIEWLAHQQQWSEAARLAESRAFVPRAPSVRVAVARGLLSQGRIREALGLVSGVPCAEAHDREMTLALRALLEEQQNGYRPNDRQCLED